MRPFAIERYFARYEHTAHHLLSSSDCESLSLGDLLELADVETTDMWESLSLGYTESAGAWFLREEIARLYGRPIAPAHVLEVVPEEGIFLSMTAILRPGDRVVATFPGYQSLYSLAEDMGCEVARWQPREEEDWRFDVDELAALVTPGTRLVVVNFPHNPTGAMLTRAEFDRVVGIAREAGAYLFCDEMYHWLEPDGVERLPAGCARYERGVTLCGLSKSFSLPGLRTGWLVTRDAELLSRIAELKDFTTICAAAPSEVLALVALRARIGITAANRTIIAGNVAAVAELVAAHPGTLSWTPPRAGSVALVRIDVPGGAAALCERLAQEDGAMLLPSTVFDYGDSHVRLGLGRVGLPAGLAVLAGRLTREGR